MDNNPFKLSAVEFIHQLKNDWQDALRREPELQVLYNEQHVERFSPQIYKAVPHSMSAAYHRMFLNEACEREEQRRIIQRSNLQLTIAGEKIEQYQVVALRVNAERLAEGYATMMTRLLAYRAAGNAAQPSTIQPSHDVAKTIIEQLNDQRTAYHLANVLFERNPHAFANNPVLSIAALPAYSWPRIIEGHSFKSSA